MIVDRERDFEAEAPWIPAPRSHRRAGGSEGHGRPVRLCVGGGLHECGNGRFQTLRLPRRRRPDPGQLMSSIAGAGSRELVFPGGEAAASGRAEAECSPGRVLVAVRGAASTGLLVRCRMGERCRPRLARADRGSSCGWTRGSGRARRRCAATAGDVRRYPFPYAGRPAARGSWAAVTRCTSTRILCALSWVNAGCFDVVNGWGWANL